MTIRTLLVLASSLALLGLAGCKTKTGDTATASLIQTSQVLPA